MPNFDPTKVAKHVIELAGGNTVAFERFDAEYDQMRSLWHQDADTIGRLLRAHLFVEHYLTELLISKFSQLGSLEDARLSFHQKVSLLGTAKQEIGDLVPGILHLNKMRNRLAHSLHADITAKDADILLSCQIFRAIRDESARQQSRPPIEEPLLVCEDFALHVGYRIQAIVTGTGKLFAEAIHAATSEEVDRKPE